MPEIALRTFPTGISMETLTRLLDDLRGRESLLQAMIGRLEQRYGGPLEMLEARLSRGEGSEHPDWEDSIEWRNAVEILQRTRIMRRVFEWLLHLIVPLPAS